MRVDCDGTGCCVQHIVASHAQRSWLQLQGWQVTCHSLSPCCCSCTSKYEYCSGGNSYSCRGGHVCEKFAPCVWPSYDPCIIDPTADGCWNDCDKYPNAPGCANDPCTRVGVVD